MREDPRDGPTAPAVETVACDVAGLSAAFCAWAEARDSTPRDAAHRAVDLLARLVAAASALDRIAGGDPPSDGRPRQSDDYRVAYRRFGAVMPVGYYATIDPLVVPSGEPTLGDVADDLADIYLELRDGLRAHRAGDTAEAVRRWCFGWRFHWGAHATGALGALRAWLASHDRMRNADSGEL